MPTPNPNQPIPYDVQVPGDTSGPGQITASTTPAQLAALLRSMAKGDVGPWLAANVESMTPAQAKAVVGMIDKAEIKAGAADQAVRIRARYEAVARDTAEAIAAGQTGSADLDKSGTVDEWEKVAFTDAAKTAGTAVSTEQAKAGVTVTPEAAAKVITTKAGVHTAIDDINNLQPDATPAWVLSQMHATDSLDPETVAALIKAYNRGNPSTPISNATELGLRLKVPTANAVAVVNAVLDGTDPITNYKFNVRDAVGNPSQVDVADTAFKSAQAGFGLDSNKVGNIVRSAATTGLTNPDGSVAWQVLAALSKAVSVNPSGGTDTAASLAGLPGSSGNVITSGGTFDTGAGTAHELRKPVPYSNADDPAFASVTQGAFNHDADSLAQLSLRFQQGLQQFGYDPTMAFVYAANPSLAMRIAGATILNGDLRIDPKDRAEATFLLSKGGFSTQNMATMGFDIPQSATYKILTDPGYLAGLLQADADKQKLDKTNAGTVKQHPDTAQLEVAQKALFQQMFFRDPTPSEFAAFASRLNSAIDTAPEGQDVNPSSRLQQFAEGIPDYQLLYGKKQAGMDDATYRQQFQAGAQSMLGNQAPNNDAIKAGMMTGKYQTTIGSIAGDQGATEDNSVFRGRLAQAAQAVNAYT